MRKWRATKCTEIFRANLVRRLIYPAPRCFFLQVRVATAASRAWVSAWVGGLPYSFTRREGSRFFSLPASFFSLRSWSDKNPGERRHNFPKGKRDANEHGRLCSCAVSDCLESNLCPPTGSGIKCLPFFVSIVSLVSLVLLLVAGAPRLLLPASRNSGSSKFQICDSVNTLSERPP